MSKQYQLTKQIHEILPKVEKKCKVKIKIESDFMIDEFGCHHFCGGLTSQFKDQHWMTILIKAPQIRQILMALERVLGENPKFLSLEYQIESLVDDNGENRIARLLERQLGKTKYMKAQALCQYWLDGLDPLFNQKPETVLKELLKILENLIK
jgi:hypothetical protein